MKLKQLLRLTSLGGKEKKSLRGPGGWGLWFKPNARRGRDMEWELKGNAKHMDSESGDDWRVNYRQITGKLGDGYCPISDSFREAGTWIVFARSTSAVFPLDRRGLDATSTQYYHFPVKTQAADYDAFTLAFHTLHVHKAAWESEEHDVNASRGLTSISSGYLLSLSRGGPQHVDFQTFFSEKIQHPVIQMAASLLRDLVSVSLVWVDRSFPFGSCT